MPQFKFVTLDVFTTTRYLGNPLAIVQIPASQNVSTEQMQTVAREFNLSETLFLHGSTPGQDGSPEWRVRIFVTNMEIPFAGHPTIGAACFALSALGQKTKGKLICNAGPIDIRYDNGVAVASIPHNFHRHSQYPLTIDGVYAIHPSLEATGQKPIAITVASPVKGMNFVCIELPDLETLGQIDTSGPEPRVKLDDEWNEGLVGSLLYVITDLPSSGEGVVKVRTRMLMGSLEDPATGSASCALCAHLALELQLGRSIKFELTQAVEMGRNSDIGVVLTLNENHDGVERIELSGSAVKVMQGMIEI